MTHMYPPPHMTHMYPPPHMTHMYPPPHMISNNSEIYDVIKKAGGFKGFRV